MAVTTIYRPVVIGDVGIAPTIHGQRVKDLLAGDKRKLKSVRFLVVGPNDAITCSRCRHAIGLVLDYKATIYANPGGYGNAKWETKDALLDLLNGNGLHPSCRHAVIILPSGKSEGPVTDPNSVKPPPGVQPLSELIKEATKAAKDGNPPPVLVKALDDIAAAIAKGEGATATPPLAAVIEATAPAKARLAADWVAELSDFAKVSPEYAAAQKALDGGKEKWRLEQKELNERIAPRLEELRLLDRPLTDDEFDERSRLMAERTAIWTRETEWNRTRKQLVAEQRRKSLDHLDTPKELRGKPLTEAMLPSTSKWGDASINLSAKQREAALDEIGELRRMFTPDTPFRIAEEQLYAGVDIRFMTKNEKKNEPDVLGSRSPGGIGKSFINLRDPASLKGDAGGVLSHEFFHHVHDNLTPQVKKEISDFYAARIAGKTFQPDAKNGGGYYPGAFPGHVYASRRYKWEGDSPIGQEVLSVGIERLGKDPVAFAKEDPEWAALMLRVIKGAK